MPRCGAHAKSELAEPVWNRAAQIVLALPEKQAIKQAFWFLPVDSCVPEKTGSGVRKLMAGLGSQELYRMVLDSLPVALCAVDREGKVILWNDGAERVTGFLRQDVLGHLCTDAFLEHADTDNNP